MATKVLMPQLGESVTEGTISKWLVQVGDVVNKYDPLCEVTTDKVTAEVPATVSGTVTDLVVPEGETVAVGSLILYIDETRQQSAAEPAAITADHMHNAAAAAAGTAAAASRADGATGSASAREAGSAVPSSGLPAAAPSVRSGKQRYSPAVRRLAQEHNLDLTNIKGTGAGGRITRKDVLLLIAQGGLSRQTAQQPAERSQGEAEPLRTAGEAAGASVTAAPQAASVAAELSRAAADQVLPVSAVRSTIANRMVQSKQEIPHAWTMVEADVTNLVNLRNQVKEEFRAKEGVNLTYLPFFIKAVVESLKEYPLLNATWAGDAIIVRKQINISLAVATEDALYVPVIKDADQKSIYGLAKAIEELVARTRAGKLTVEDMSGGTFTVNNTGSFGSVLSMPIINPPQAAIVTVESIVKRPVVIDDMIAIRSMVHLCLSFDHRVTDGLTVGRFLQAVKRKLEAIGPETPLY